MHRPASQTRPNDVSRTILSQTCLPIIFQKNKRKLKPKRKKRHLRLFESSRRNQKSLILPPPNLPQLLLIKGPSQRRVVHYPSNDSSFGSIRSTATFVHMPPQKSYPFDHPTPRHTTCFSHHHTTADPRSSIEDCHLTQTAL